MHREKQLVTEIALLTGQIQIATNMLSKPEASKKILTLKNRIIIKNFVLFTLKKNKNKNQKQTHTSKKTNPSLPFEQEL